jgi:hypothetical protein
MKKTLARLAFPSVLAAAMLPTSCATSNVKRPSESVACIYETAEEIQAMPPCKATVVHTYPCYSLLRTSDAKKFCIGSPGATPEVSRFVETLTDRQSYRFPGVFVDYQRNYQEEKKR